MATVERFEDLEVWIKARELTKLIYEITAKDDFAKDFGLRDQLRRAYVAFDNGFIDDSSCEKLIFLLKKSVE
ncbi:four helix bundle protein [Hydrogenispora ethanolica]|uniref:four helix bundle protein n=1 Tax=Hydrogenispora ethanolica TaxID=1082276 RepID=UPI00104935EB|nr:four helix bundle protein [Hydrogenispora ethanolica]